MVEKRIVQICMLALCLAISGAANATYHLWRISQLYSNADGTVQYIQLTALAGGQQFISGHTITSSQGATTRSYTFPTDLPGDTAIRSDDYYGTTTYKSFLIGTQGFAALGVVAPRNDSPYTSIHGEIARLHRAPLVTSDVKLRKLKEVTTIW